MLLIKESCNLIGRYLAAPSQKYTPRHYLPLMTTYMQKISWFLPEILLIKGSCNLIGGETQKATPNQTWGSQMLPSFEKDAISIQKSKKSINNFYRFWWSKSPAIWFDSRQNWPKPTKGRTLICSLFLMSTISLDERHTWRQLVKSSSLRSYFSWMMISLQKI